jgi:hypothetical protein
MFNKASIRVNARINFDASHALKAACMHLTQYMTVQMPYTVRLLDVNDSLLLP